MGRHVPRLFLPRPWDSSFLALSEPQIRHLGRSLRLSSGSVVTYTDGGGVVGEGQLVDDRIERGSEQSPKARSTIRLAVAPPKSADRVRFIVEKLQEMGVGKLTWLTTTYAQGRPPRSDKSRAWAVSALEQSRGIWLMEIEGPISLRDIDRPLVADADGSAQIDPTCTVCIGPEGRWAEEEILDSMPVASLGSTVLWTETAALVAATHAIIAGVGGRDEENSQ
jgi:16S rRNA (uracil1498-N3)-methyltransferase